MFIQMRAEPQLQYPSCWRKEAGKQFFDAMCYLPCVYYSGSFLSVTQASTRIPSAWPQRSRNSAFTALVGFVHHDRREIRGTGV